ncbi:acyl-CoA dehydrogenase/oxidase C-terminal [Cadophora sp. DSE1049]|nr:acyl-CoA dehydrogenase/oxidase C-terminal [Cadophora sp. DSE1049]
MSPQPRKASSSNEGFFQPIPTIQNQFFDDAVFRTVLKFFLPKPILDSVTVDFSKFGEEVLSKKVLDWITDAERNVPYLKGGGRDAFGRRTSELVVTEGWKRLQNFGIQNGIVATGYEDKYGEHTRVVQFLKLHLWTGSCANVACPSAMTDGAARLLSLHLSSKALDPSTRAVFVNAYDRLTSRDSEYAWTSGQWMTERSGGSDVSGTETIATHSPRQSSNIGDWSIDGFKWFSSATDSSMSILLAQTSKGLSTFLAPMRRPILEFESGRQEGELNGIFIQRLKNKFGTKSLPTAELELSGTRAYLIGEEGRGIQEISTILDITRLYSAVSAVGYLGRGLAIARSFAQVREVGAGRGKRVMLRDSPLHMSTLARIAGEYKSMMLYAFFVASLMGANEHGTKGDTDSIRLAPERIKDVPLLIRILTPVLKASVCKRSIHALQECMEALGGVGYLENGENESINIARLYRDCCVLSIWEGTTDVLASDTLRVLKGKNGEDVLGALDRWVTASLRLLALKHPLHHAALAAFWSRLRGSISGSMTEELLPKARELTFDIANVIMGTLLLVEAESNSDLASLEVCTRFLLDKGIVTREETRNDEISATAVLGINQRIVYGDDGKSERPKL